MPLRESVECNSSLPNDHARHCAFCRRRTEAVGTHHRVLEISTIDASSYQTHAACSLSQVIEGFADEQSSAALTEHTPSSYLFAAHRTSTKLPLIQPMPMRIVRWGSHPLMPLDRVHRICTPALSVNMPIHAAASGDRLPCHSRSQHAFRHAALTLGLDTRWAQMWPQGFRGVAHLQIP